MARLTIINSILSNNIKNANLASTLRYILDKQTKSHPQLTGFFDLNKKSSVNYPHDIFSYYSYSIFLDVFDSMNKNDIELIFNNTSILDYIQDLITIEDLLTVFNSYEGFCGEYTLHQVDHLINNAQRAVLIEFFTINVTKLYKRYKTCLNVHI